MSLVHGGNVYEIALQLGCTPETILDYSASINPLGPPPGLAEEFQAHFHHLQHYPDIGNRALLRSLCRHHRIAEDKVVVGNGSTELIYWMPKALGIRKAVVVLPTFSEYQKAFELQEVALHKLITTADHDFQPTVAQLEAACAEASPEAVLLTHPASPAGTLLPKPVREWLIAQSRRNDLTCIIDEVFVDFCEEESLKGFLEESPRLALIRSMTKFYGIPGLRLGYMLASTPLADRMRRVLPPWSVNRLAQLAGTYCLCQGAYQDATLDMIARERGALLDGLSRIPGCRAFAGAANYVLVALDKRVPPAATLQHDLLASDSILIRDCSSFEGLGDHYVRFAIRLPEQNRKLLNAFTRWMDAHSS